MLDPVMPLVLQRIDSDCFEYCPEKLVFEKRPVPSNMPNDARSKHLPPVVDACGLF